MVVTSDNIPVPGMAKKADNGAINDVTILSVDSALAPTVAIPTNVENIYALSTVLPLEILILPMRSYGCMASR